VPVGAAGGAGAAPTTVRVTLLATDNRFDIPGPLTADQVAADPRQANALYATRRERRHNRVARVAAGADHRVGPHALGGTMFLNPKYLQRSERGTYRDFTRQHMGGNLVYAYEGAVAGRAHRITAGVDGAYQDGAILFYSLTPAGTRGTTLRTNKSEAAANLGAFAQDEISLGGRATLTLGTRYDAVRYDYRDFIAPRLDDRRGFARLTPKLGLSVRVAPLHAVYAAVGGGLEAPAGNETDPAPPLDTVRAINPLLDPIRSTTYETGAKGTFFRSGAAVRRLAYDAALYLTDVRNEIVPYAGGRFYFTAGRARRAGAELGLSADVAGGFALRAAGTLNRHRYADYVVDSVHYGRAGVLADYGGNHVVGVPDLFYSGEAIWSARDALPGGALGRTGVELRLGVQGTGPYFADDANRVRVAPYTVTSATLSFAPTFGRRAPLLPGGAGSGVRAFVTVENLLDRRYTASAFLNPDRLGGAPLAFEPGLPRGVVIGLSVGHRR
jgi:iron complex outermembrane receptor protein